MPLSASPQFRERERTYHVLHYTIKIRVDEQRRKVEGAVTVKIVPLTQLPAIEIDAAEMNIPEVTYGNVPAPLHFSQRGEKLFVTPPRTIGPEDTLALTIHYSCSPRNGLYFFAPDSAYPTRPTQVWSQGENEDNHFWFPCYDYPNDKATVDMMVTVNQQFTAISNGALIGITDNPETNTKTFHWYSAKPISSYLISLVVGDYTKIEEAYKGVPVQYYVYPTQKQDAPRSFSKTPDMMKFFSQKIGYDYPWQKYAQTVINEFTYGGMENASATTLTDKTIHGERAHLDISSDNLVAHELAHQWFGDLLTCRSWAHSWLNEGFASYFQALYVEHDKGWDEYQFDMLEKQRSVVETDSGLDRRPTVTDLYDDPVDVFDGRIYAKGAAVLHMLRGLLGDQKFWAGIKHYVDLYQYDIVATRDFQRSMEEATGQDLGEFFNQWIYHAGFPQLEVSQRYDPDARKLYLVVRQTQQVDSLTPFFRFPVSIDVVTTSGATVYPVTITAQPEQTIALSVQDTPLNVTVDKGGWILKTLTHEKPISSWIHQLKHGDVADRIAALGGLEPMIGHPEIREAISTTLSSDQFWGVRKRSAEVLGRWHDPSLLGLLAPALTDSSSRVRVAAIEGLQNIHSEDAATALRRLWENDPSYAVAAQAIQSLVANDPTHGLAYCEKGLLLDSHNDIIRAGVAKALGILRTAGAKKRLFALTAYGGSLELRQAAIEALADNWKNDPSVRVCLEQLTDDRMERVRRRAIEKLGTIASPNSRAVLNGVLRSSPDVLLRREARRALTKIERATRS